MTFHNLGYQEAAILMVVFIKRVHYIGDRTKCRKNNNAQKQNLFTKFKEQMKALSRTDT